MLFSAQLSVVSPSGLVRLIKTALRSLWGGPFVQHRNVKPRFIASTAESMSIASGSGTDLNFSARCKGCAREDVGGDV